MNKKPQSLEPRKEVSIDTKTILLGCILFALAFWIVGSIFKYYIPVGA